MCQYDMCVTGRWALCLYPGVMRLKKEDPFLLRQECERLSLVSRDLCFDNIRLENLNICSISRGLCRVNFFNVSNFFFTTTCSDIE